MLGNEAQQPGPDGLRFGDVAEVVERVGVDDGGPLARLRDHAHEVLAPAEVDVTFEVPAALPPHPLPPEALHQPCLICKEVLHNVVKHAQATQVTVTRVV